MTFGVEVLIVETRQVRHNILEVIFCFYYPYDKIT